MAKIRVQPTVTLQLHYELTETEARALDALSGYGADAFLKVFYEHLGKSYLQPYEMGLRSLFESVRRDLPPLLDRATAARELFNGRRNEGEVA